jgi:hypothetical protein
MILVFCKSSNVGKMVFLLSFLLLMLRFLCVHNLLMFLMLFPLPLKKGLWFMFFIQGDQLLILMIDSRIKYLKPRFPSINIVWM